MLKSNGFTLIELMVSITIISILLTITLPNLDHFIVSMRVDNEITSLHRLILLTRNYAINSGQEVTMCPLDTNNQCNTNWKNSIGVFIDRNKNKALDPGEDEILIRSKDPVKLGDDLIYGKNRDRIIYKPTGQLRGFYNGTLIYCPKNYQSLSRGIVISRSGRSYKTTDSDNNGRNDRNNKEITCTKL